MKKKTISMIVVLTLVITAFAILPLNVSAEPNSVASSTMHFEGSLTDAGGGIYTGTIDMTAGEYYIPGGPGELIHDGGGFDVYAKEGETAYVQGYYGSGPWNDGGQVDTLVIGYFAGAPHDAYPSDMNGGPWGSWYNPDCTDWSQYSLELTTDHWYLRYTATDESPMSGTMDWTNMYAEESDLGTQDGGHGGSGAHGGGAHAWDWDCGWGVEVIPLELDGFAVTITDLGGGDYHVTLTPSATPDEIEQAISDGIAWLVSQQDTTTGKWQDVPRTGFALIKLQDRAYELGKDPFETDSSEPDYYEYATNVIDGWEYLFSVDRPGNPLYAKKQTIGNQDHTTGASGTNDDPDTRVNGYGIYFGPSYTVYSTGICLMALVASGTPNRVNDGGIDYDGDGAADTFGEIAQDVVDWLAFAQADVGTYEGGYDYGAQDNQCWWGDNSNSGYAYLGLAAAEATTARPGATAFGCTVPGWVKTELNAWISYIQCTTPGGNYGGSGYGSPCDWVNELKTGNLIFEMTFYSDSPGVTRFDDALDYIENHWHDANYQPGWGYNQGAPAHYQAMYCLMKGLEYSGINLIDLDGDGTPEHDWYNEFASVLVAQQNADGSWSSSPCYVWPDGTWGTMSGTILSTIWALLVLEKITPPPPTRYPTDDSYTDQRIPYRNYGTATTLWAYHKPYPIDRYMWLKFDLTGIPADATAKLYLHPHSSYGSPRTCNRIFGAHFCSDDSWDELTITWNNQPGFNAAPEDTVTNPVRCTPIEFNVTSIVQSEIAAGEQYISFVVKSEENCYMDWLCAYSTDHPDQDLWPYLDIS